MTRSRKLAIVLVVLVGVLCGIQFVPYGRDHNNPPDAALVSWNAPATEALAKRACFDCHSNRTKWPWYSSFAPISWRVQSHVDEGRETLNFTAFKPADKHVAKAARKALKEVAEGDMPPGDYLLMHPEARLSPGETRALSAGLKATFATLDTGKDQEGDDDRD